MTDIGTLSGEFAWANAINDAGQVVGYSGKGETHAFVYSQGKMTDLGTLGGKASAAVGINNLGQVVGASMTGSGQIHAFLYIGETESIAAAPGNCHHRVSQASTKATTLHATKKMTDLGTLARAGTSTNGKLPLVESMASGINSKGQVVGTSITAKGKMHAFLYSQGKMTDLGTLGGEESTANAINDKGQVVGTSMTASGKSHAFLWYKGTMTDLNAAIAASNGMILDRATGINNSGQIVGVGIIKNHYKHAFLIAPN